MRNAIMVGLVSMAAVAALSGCTGSSTPAHHSESGSAQVVTVHATNLLRFQPATITAHVGTIRITLVDDGAYPHNLSMPALHTTSTTVTGNPGSTRTTVTLRFAHPGTFAFECTYHASAGMRGKIVIQSS